MTVIVMKVIKAAQHPNADALRVYEMQSPGITTLQVITNLEQTYEVGDRIAIAQVGSVLKDGTKIKATKLRGLVSNGMALGKTDEPIGKDVSDLYCQQAIDQRVQVQQWPSIGLLYKVRRSLNTLQAAPAIAYRAKIKLNGTNAGVQVFSDGQVVAQSRSQIITPKADNMGFAQWVSQHVDYFVQLAGRHHLTIFGEWCGQGIQKRKAISQIDRKIFAVFAVQFDGIENEVATLEIEPDKIAQLLPKHPDIFVLPFMGDPLLLDFGDHDQMESTVAILNQLVTRVEHSDPWVKDTFGIDGLGEGVVFYPQSNILEEWMTYSELMFKAKGEKHQVVKTKKLVQLDPEQAQSIEQFVALMVTPARLEQGVTEACGGQLDMPHMGAFLKWLTNDVQKESEAELEAAQLLWKDVQKAITNVGKQWYRDRVMSVAEIAE